MNEIGRAVPRAHVEVTRQDESEAPTVGQWDTENQPKSQDMTRVLARIGVDLPYLQALPQGTHGRAWPSAWKLATKLLYVSGGYSPSDIARAMPDGPRKETIHGWAEAENWQLDREAFTTATTAKALAETGEDQAHVVARHLKALRVVEAAALEAVLTKKVEGRSLEGVIAALVQAFKLEREVLGLEGPPQVTTQDNRTQIMVAQLGEVPEDRLDEYLAAMRAKFEIDAQLSAIASHSAEILPGPHQKNASGEDSFPPKE